MPTIQDIEDFQAATHNWSVAMKDWCEEQITRLSNNEGIGSNPGGPPPPPPGVTYDEP